MSRSVTILGSTGSVGKATLDVIQGAPEQFSIHTLTAQKNISLLAEQAKTFKAKRAVIVIPPVAALASATARPIRAVPAAFVTGSGLDALTGTSSRVP